MSSKRENFFKLCRKLWTASAAAVAATALFISGNHFTGVAHAQQWGGADVTITAPATVSGTAENAGSLIVNDSLTIQNGGSVTTSKNAVIGNNYLKDGSVSVSGTNSSFTVGTSEELPVTSLDGNGSLTVESGAKLKLESGSGMDDAARLTLDGNINITGSATTVSIGSYGLLNGTGAMPNTTLGAYDLGTGNGDGSVTINGAKVEMGSSAGLLGGKGVMTISNATFSQIGLTGSQTIATAGNMSVTNSNFNFGENFLLRSEGAMNLSGTNLNGSSIIVRSGSNMVLSDTNITGTDGGMVFSGGSLEMSSASSIDQSGSLGLVQSLDDLTLANDSEILQGNTSVVSVGGGLTISSGSKIEQENDGEIVAIRGNITLNGGSITQGLDGVIRTNTESSAGSLVLSNGASIDQACGATIAITDSISLTGGSSILQGQESVITAGDDLIVTDAIIAQDDESRINAGGAIDITRSTVTQGDESYIVGGTDVTISGAGTVVTQDDGSLITSGALLSITDSAMVVQGDESVLSGQFGVNIGADASVTQEDYGVIKTEANQNITIAGTVKQGVGGDIRTSGTGKLNLTGADIAQGKNSTIRSDSTETLVVSGATITQGQDGTFRTGGDLEITDNSFFAQDASSDFIAGGNITVNNGAYVSLGYAGVLQTNETLSIDNAVLNLGGGMQIVGATGNQTDKTTILLGTNGQLLSDGLLRFNNDSVVLGDSSSRLHTSGIFYASNKTQIEGIGTISASNGTIVEGGSVLRPGLEGEIGGTMTVIGSLTIRDGGVLQIRLGEDWANDKLVVEDTKIRDLDGNVIGTADDGSVTLGNAVLEIKTTQEDFLNGNRTITFLSAESGVYGEFKYADVSEHKFLTVTQTVTGEEGKYQEVSVEVKRTDFFTDETRKLGMSHNQQNVGLMLDSTDLSGQWWDALTVLGNLDEPSFGMALDKISGRIKSNSMTMYRETPWRNAMDQISWTPNGRVLMGNQSRYCPSYRGQENCNKASAYRPNYANYCGNQREVWATPFYSDGSFRDDGNGGRYSIDNTGFMAGISQRLTNTSTVGLIFGYSRPELKQDGDTVEMDDFIFGGQFGMMLTSKVEMKAIVLGGFQSYDMERNLSPSLLPELNGPTRLTSDFDGNTLLASVEFARPFYFSNCAMLRPLVAFDSENVWQDATSERGNSIYNLKFKKRRDDRTFVRTGLTGEFGGNNFTLTGKAIYSHQLGGQSYSRSEVAFLDAGMTDTVDIRGVDLDRHYMTVGAGGKFYLDPMRRKAFAAGYDATFSEKATQQNVFVSVSYLF